MAENKYDTDKASRKYSRAESTSH